MRDHDRIIDPRDIGRGIRERRLGAIPERALQREQETQNKFDRAHPLILTATLGPWFREDVAAGSDVSMRLIALGASSTNPAVANLMYNAATGTNSGIVSHNPVRIIGGTLFTPSTITAGTVTLCGRAAGVITPMADVELNSASTRGVTAWLGWHRGIPVAAGATIDAILRTSSGYLPITTDVSAWLFIGWEEPT